MKNVIIKQMRLVNFKGLRDFTINFGDQMTSVLGRNGSGKTTIFDAFTWLLFGKDSSDRKAFNIKTLDGDGNVIPRIPHEVSATLAVDGEEIKLCRRFNEKWQKRRGETEEIFTGHEEERLYNDVPMSVKDWNEKTAAICTEQVFKFITNPRYFTAQKTDVQRAMLFRMAGNVSDEEIAAGNADFAALLADMTGKTMEEYKREIAAKKRRIKDEIGGIPERIDERRRDMPEAENWLLLDADLSAKEDSLRDLDRAIMDVSEAYKAESNGRLELRKKISDLARKKQERETEIKNSVFREYDAAVSQQRELAGARARHERELSLAQNELKSYQYKLERLKSCRETLIKEWREIKARELKFDSGEFVCPACGRPLDIEDIERKQREMTANFNTKKAADLENNIKAGQQVKSDSENIEKLANGCKERIAALEADIKAIEENPLYGKNIVTPDAAPAIEADGEVKRLGTEIAKLEAEADAPMVLADTSALTERKAAIVAQIGNIKKRLAKRDTIERNEARIRELEKQYKEQGAELASLEGIEYTMAAFSKARTEAVENHINNLFSLVKFKMFEQQINGGEVETCEATANGVPYSGQNNAMQINMGIDIINAICKFEGVTAPIFIDNAESINEIMPTQSQMIRLIVTDNEHLKVQ